ncbi:S-layer homology domain-containing protein [Deinococcus radiomollis]|uniref:S-layer homology domain-containing protein n=1 Tax=Deinococcus radiomollis TaxID=468916 RepID=UPI00389234E1
MKKSLIVLTAALSFGFAAAQSAAPAQVPTLTDVPAGHWAKDAIDKIVAKGIILGYPDGTFRGTQNLTRYEAAVIIARLLDQIATGTVTTTTGQATTVTGDDLAALQNAVQELAADLAALGVRVTDLEANSVSQDDFARLEARVEALGTATAPAGDTAALDALTAQIADVNARVDDLQANYDGLRADVDDNASSIAALNDLTVLLNNDILGLQDRVSAVETTIPDLATRADLAALGTKVTGIDTRVTTLENAPKISFTGSVPLTYGSIGLIAGGTNFDVDRLTRRTFAAGVFSSGTDCTNGADHIQAFAEACTDTTNNYSGFDFTFGLKVSNIATANGSLIVSDAVANFGITSANFTTLAGTNTSLTNLVYFKNATINGKLAGQDFRVVYDYQNSAFTFNDYLFNNNNDAYPVNKRNGAVITLNATSLPLAPKLTIVAGNGIANVGTPVLLGNYFGVRAEVNPYGLGTIGLNYARNVGNRSAAGIDANFKVGAFNLKGLFDVSAPDGVAGGFFNGGNKASYAQASADLGIAKIAANFRAIDPAYYNGVAGMSANDRSYYSDIAGNANGYPYNANEVGYGAGLSTTLGPVTIAAFGDRASNYSPTTDTTSLAYNNGSGNTTTFNTPNSSYFTNFGVAVGANLYGLSLKGFYNSSRNDLGALYATGYDPVTGAPTTVANRSVGVHIDPLFFAYNSTAAYQDTALVPFAFSSTYGGVLSHDGSAANALVKGLNFTIADAYFYNDNINDFQVYGSYAATLGGLTVTPFGRYHMFNVPGNNGGATTTTSDGTATRTYTAAKYGLQVTSVPLDMIGKPSVGLSFANSITTPGGSIALTNNAKTELFAQAALTLNDIGIAGLVPSVGYAYYQGFNVGSATIASSASGGTATFSPTADRIYRSPLGGASDPYTGANLGAASGSTQGVFAQLNYLGIGLNYGLFYYRDFNNGANNSAAQAFKVSYNVNF